MKTKSNRIKDVVDYINNELKNRYSQNEIKAFTNILFSEYADMNSAHLLAFNEDTINESSLLNIVLATERLKKYEPIQYILEHTEFCGLNIKVTPDVLIPRPETEELTQMIINENKQENIKIIDLCCGSGCIALSLNKFIKNSLVFGIDISENALKIAKENCKNLNLDVKFYQTNLLECGNKNFFSEMNKFFLDFSKFFSEENKVLNNSVFKSHFDSDFKFDVIVSNPPYVMDNERIMMKNNVLDYEPSLALFVKNENPLIFYEKIAVFAQKYLNSNGKIYLEINENLANPTLSLFSQKEYFAEIRKDIFNKDRFIFLQKKS